MSLWDDHYAQMDWLDGTQPAGSTAPGAKRGPCAAGSGDPNYVEKNFPSSKVVYSDIRHGPIGSTAGGAPGPSPSGCPGGSLPACIGLCPANPPAAYKACVEDCTKRCA